MKEITRIHIAKVPYDAEVEAKKELESYIKKLEVYSTDTEIINDIEIRITEILAERGVNKNGVVTMNDVKALKEQLGEPRDFMGDGDVAIGPDDVEQPDVAPRKLFRDVDNAVLGGVMSGIGAFFGVNPLWVRLLFVLIAFASFGTALLVYIVLWIAVPAAKTAADKLQMTGRPVTIASIREINESEVMKSDNPGSGRRILTAIAGTFLALGAAISLMAVVGITAGVLFHDKAYLAWSGESTGFLTAAFILAVVSGLLLAVLFTLGSYAAFAQKLTRRVIISSIVVVVMGLTSFGTAIGLAQYGASLERQAIEENTHTVNVTLPEGTKATTSLNVLAPHFNVEYIVEAGEPRAEMRVVTEKGKSIPKVATKIEGAKLTIEVNKDEARKLCYWPGCNGSQQKITVYGPALQSIEANSDSYVVYTGSKQATLQLTAKKNATMTVDAGTIDQLEVVTEDEAVVSASDATIQSAKLTFGSDSTMSLGTVQKLEVTNANSCPAGKRSHLDIWNAESLTVNGATQPVESARLTCLTVSVEGDENDRS
jgi:phage shock protein PspC (stress-responsive transcriptional regulator)